MSRLDKIRAIPIREVFQQYGFEVNRAGFCRCPFHHEKTPSCIEFSRGWGHWGF